MNPFLPKEKASARLHSLTFAGPPPSSSRKCSRLAPGQAASDTARFGGWGPERVWGFGLRSSEQRILQSNKPKAQTINPKFPKPEASQLTWHCLFHLHSLPLTRVAQADYAVYPEVSSTRVHSYSSSNYTVHLVPDQHVGYLSEAFKLRCLEITYRMRGALHVLVSLSK